MFKLIILGFLLVGCSQLDRLNNTLVEEGQIFEIVKLKKVIEQCLTQFSDQVDLGASPILPPKYRRNQPQGNQPSFDLRTHLYRICFLGEG
jgi:hypothetical protein